MVLEALFRSLLDLRLYIHVYSLQIREFFFVVYQFSSNKNLRVEFLLFSFDL
jgi:hypothetical protein